MPFPPNDTCLDTSAAGTVWPTWVYSYQSTSTAGTATASCVNIWPAWVASYSATVSTTATYSGVIWQQWVDGTGYYAAQPFQEANERVKEHAAVARAEELLREHLNEEQRSSYDMFREFLCKAQSGKTYRIRKGTSNNVFLLNDEGAEIMRFCIHPQGVPDGDAMLAQKLMLETDEKSFTRIANKTQLVAA